MYINETVQKHNTNVFVIKPTRCTSFTNLFCHETLHVSDSSCVHHQEFIHCTLSKFVKLVNLVGFITKKFATMHGHMNLKKQYK